MSFRESEVSRCRHRALEAAQCTSGDISAILLNNTTCFHNSANCNLSLTESYGTSQDGSRTPTVQRDGRACNSSGKVGVFSNGKAARSESCLECSLNTSTRESLERTLFKLFFGYRAVLQEESFDRGTAPKSPQTTLIPATVAESAVQIKKVCPIWIRRRCTMGIWLWMEWV